MSHFIVLLGGFVGGVVVCRLYYTRVIAEGKRVLANIEADVKRNI